MKINKKWHAAAAGAIALALVGSGATAASAAPGDFLNPQPEGSAAAGSKGGFYLWDANEAVYADTDDGSRVYAKDEPLNASTSKTDILGEINPAATRPVSGGTSFTQTYRFLSKQDATSRDGGINTWNAYAVDAASGPNGGTLTPDFTLESISQGPGGIADDIATGGKFWYGVAYTNFQGVQVVGTVYREITIEAGTGNYRVTPSVVESAPAGPVVTTQPASASVEAGATATFTAAATNSTAVKWQSKVGAAAWADVAGATSATLSVANTTLAQTGTQYRAVFQPGDVATDAATLTVTPAAPTEPTTGTPGNLGENVVLEEGAQSFTLTNTGITAGTYGVWAWSTPTQLPNATVDAAGDVTIAIAGLTPGEHTIALVNVATNAIVGWITITVPQPTNESTTDLTVDVVTSNKFALEGVNAAVDLGEVKRGATTVAKSLTPFTVTDDRATLPGWNLTAAVDDFTNASAGNDVIGKSAFGLTPQKVGAAVAGITLGADQVAGSAVYNSLFAEGGADSSTGEAGTQFDAVLSFKAPMSAKAGAYTSKLTLTLTSK